MGAQADQLWIKQFQPFYDGKTVLEAGAGHNDCHVIRQAVEGGGGKYIGVDMNDHPNVDIQHNLDDPLDIAPVDMVIALSLLEHCEHPWLVAKTLQDILNPGGVLALCVPFAWRIHGYPYDYWRFTPRCIGEILFKGVEWKELQPVPKVDIGWHFDKPVMIYGWGRKKPV